MAEDKDDKKKEIRKTKKELDGDEEQIRTQLMTQLNYFGGLRSEHATLFVAFIFGKSE